MQGAKQQEFLLERDFALYLESGAAFFFFLLHCIHSPSFSSISLLTSFLPSSPPAAQVPVLFAVAGSRSSVLQSGSPTFLHTHVVWKNSQGLKPPLIAHSSLFFHLSASPSIFVRLLKISQYSCWSLFFFNCQIRFSLRY